MLGHKKFEDGMKFLMEAIATVNNEQCTSEDLARLIEQYKKWHGFHTPTGIVIGGERRLVKMGARSILCYQIYLNTQLSISRLRKDVENDLLMCLAHWEYEAIFSTIAQENPGNRELQIQLVNKDNLVIKTDETGDWWLLVEERRSIQPL